MNKVRRNEGRYDILHPSDKSAQYAFTFREDAPKELNRSFLIDLDRDGDFSGSALEVAQEIKYVIDSYWLHTAKSKIADVVNYLELWSEKDEYDELKLEREKLTKRLEDIENKLGGYDPEEWDNWKPEVTDSTAPHSEAEAETDQ